MKEKLLQNITSSILFSVPLIKSTPTPLVSCKKWYLFCLLSPQKQVWLNVYWKRNNKKREIKNNLWRWWKQLIDKVCVRTCNYFYYKERKIKPRIEVLKETAFVKEKKSLRGTNRKSWSRWEKEKRQSQETKSNHGRLQPLKTIKQTIQDNP